MAKIRQIVECVPNFSEISDTIKSGVDYIVRYRQEDLSKAAPSHIIKLGAGGLVKIIR